MKAISRKKQLPVINESESVIEAEKRRTNNIKLTKADGSFLKTEIFHK